MATCHLADDRRLRERTTSQPQFVIKDGSEPGRCIRTELEGPDAGSGCNDSFLTLDFHIAMIYYEFPCWLQLQRWEAEGRSELLIEVNVSWQKARNPLALRPMSIEAFPGDAKSWDASRTFLTYRAHILHCAVVRLRAGY
jgi:hypothetical protein